MRFVPRSLFFRRKRSSPSPAMLEEEKTTTDSSPATVFLEAEGNAHYLAPTCTHDISEEGKTLAVSSTDRKTPNSSSPAPTVEGVTAPDLPPSPIMLARETTAVILSPALSDKGGTATDPSPTLCWRKGRTRLICLPLCWRRGIN